MRREGMLSTSVSSTIYNTYQLNEPLNSAVARKYLISLLLEHPIHGLAHQLRSNSLTTVLRLHSQHSDVASHRAATVRLEFADDDTDELVIVVQSHKAQVSPLVEEVTVDIDTVWL